MQEELMKFLIKAVIVATVFLCVAMIIDDFEIDWLRVVLFERAGRTF